MHKSFKNFTYFIICLMASKRGILTSTLLKVSRRAELSSTFFAVMNLEGKGRWIYFGAEFVLALSSILAPTSVGFGSSLSLFKVITLTSSILAPTSVGFGSSLSFFKVTTLVFPFGLIIGYVGILPEPCCYNWLTIVANYPIWVCRFLLVTLTFCWNWMLLVVVCLINSSKEVPELLFCTGCADGNVECWNCCCCCLKGGAWYLLMKG